MVPGNDATLPLLGFDRGPQSMAINIDMTYMNNHIHYVFLR